MFRILEKGKLIKRREEKSVYTYIRGDMGDYGDQRAIGERRQWEGGRGGEVEIVTMPQ